MSVGLLGALCAALCTGVAALLQAIGARRVGASAGVDPRLLWRLTRSVPYVAGLAMSATAFVLSLLALRSVPLFVVQAIVASNLAVVAVLSWCVLRHKLRLREWLAVSAVLAGVALLAMSTDPTRAESLAWAGRWALLGGVILVGALALGHRRLNGAAGVGLLAGLTYGICAVSSRVVGNHLETGTALLQNPATYALALGGALGTLLYATALQRGSVTAASAMTIVGQTLGPSAVGILLLGDGSRPGFAVAATVGFVLAVLGAVMLSRHAEVKTERA